MGQNSRPEYNAPARPAPKTLPSPVAGTPLGVTFIDVAKQSGLNARTIYGGEHKNKYLLETTGCGVAFYDYDHDDWIDIFLVNGTRLEGFSKDQTPTCHLFKNNRDGTFTDVTIKAGLARSGWGQGVCVGDYNNDGWDDIFIAYYGQNALFRNNGDGTFTDVTAKAGLLQPTTRWNSGCAFLDYDRDGHLDLFVANYIDFDIKTAPDPAAAGCAYKGIQVACGPPGLQGGKNILYHNNGDGTFTDVSEKAGILDTVGTYGLSVGVADFDNDGWPDIYVANDSTAATLYQNQKNGTFKDVAIESGVAYSPDGKPQAGMGVSIGDFNRDGLLDIVKTNFAGDTASLYQNLGGLNFDDRTYLSGIGINTRYLGWGVGFFDMDNDGWLDIMISNGHVYPEVDGSHTDAPYAERKYLYRNLRNGQFEEVTDQAGPGMTTPVPGRGCAFGDYDNNGHPRCRRQLHQRHAAAPPLRLHAHPKLDQDPHRRHQIQPHRNRRSHQSHRTHRNRNHARQTTRPDRRSPQRRQLLLAERPPHPLRPRPGKDRRRRNPLALRPDRLPQKPRRQSPLRHPGRRQDPQVRRLPHGRRKSSREEVGR